MPIKENGTSIEYDMPECIKNLITKEYATKFCECMKQVFPKVSFDDERTLSDFEGTSGWHEAFVDAFSTSEVLSYYKTLEWYDSDIFDSQLSKIVADYGIVAKGGYDRD